MGDDNRLFDIKTGHFKLLTNFFLRIKLGTLVNTHTNFCRKQMRITKKILSFQIATFNIGRPLYFPYCTGILARIIGPANRRIFTSIRTF